MSKLKEIKYNCKQATFLIEKKQLSKLSFREQIELKIHLAGCSVCKLYEQQSIFITKLTKHIFNQCEKKAFTLDQDFKDKMQQRVEKELHKK